MVSFILGNIGLAVASTIIAAIISKAGAKGTLYPVFSFPILLPLILTSVQLTLLSNQGASFTDAKIELAIDLLRCHNAHSVLYVIRFCMERLVILKIYQVNNMVWKIFLFLFLAFVSIAGIAFPIVPVPHAWYQFPLIPGLKENAKIIFFHVPTAWLSRWHF